MGIFSNGEAFFDRKWTRKCCSTVVLVAIVPVAGNQFVNLSIVLFEKFYSNVNFAAKIFRWIRNVLIEVVSEFE